ncbi:class I SAM-dependent methyltransferase [Clostridium tagluense]|uniref:class I SAM-dependent methyltransferase n=1 Tax=Clostridium tagluense TaxID=360422 RepID=UPI001CF5272F|nr:methyltransferase domain-containing protein [Clostridium tagluense]MCB2299254.1 class I SAM-dependent methyltransferase [Clostridium tagluense]
MNEQSISNKKAWEYRAYEFWNNRDGSPMDNANKILKNPKACLKKHKEYFNHIEGKKIANICDSNGRKAVPLALMGAAVTVFDISEENRKYALELAKCANTSIDYIVCDIYDVDLKKYEDFFDILYLEGGILHYFNDINKLMSILYSLLKDNGVMVLSDFNPLRKCIDEGNSGQTQGNYFDEELHNADVAYKQFFSKQEQCDFPDCYLRFYTLSEIINSVIIAGFELKKFDEHPKWENENIPGEFTILAVK